MQLGYADVDAMLAGMTGRQVAEWRAYYQIEPFGEYRADLRSAIIASTFANCFSRKRFKVEDFMPEFGPRRRQSVEEMKAIFSLFVQAHNQSLNRG